MAQIYDHSNIRIATRAKEEHGSFDTVTTVLVTGYGPFLQEHEDNSSWRIASTLPSILPATRDHPIPIRIVVYPWPIRVSYQAVLDLVPSLVEKVNPDIILHIGLASGRNFYAIEHGAHKSIYGTHIDVDGQGFPQERSDEAFGDLPSILETGFDVHDLYRRWKAEIPDANADIRTSPDAGNFLCGFIYYTSMSLFAKMKRAERPVMFFHVPYLSTEEQVDEGREVTKGLIRALDESRARRGTHHGNVGAGSRNT
ncbi:peptidase C15, pyroglutamyl peptidase I-like protein [Pseudovirgaria hyperparasitica]|uniref:Peptidase C15, pyroglutamyl peptidase I-like protein n=1 Tax=Pseudovirgaria hyperparasitica TaxID=470096 RepID=A0A6A6WI44_9PEZI|nr:peptidase C15, pyroglutamyl peptidase I-like protein [Pseudovirgaria hyperparasitica]KAF2760821.1 peptidase C15, pyroglutamyl peptidase I-like protein [Pseudovirgaria hyperparasitica]